MKPLRVAAATLAFACSSSASPPTDKPAPPVVKAEATGSPASNHAEDPTVTTVSKYQLEPARRLPPVKGASAYKRMTDRTVRFAINVWAGWAPVVLANGGFRSGVEWTTPSGKPFKVELILVDNSVTMRDAFASGEAHIGWASVDMLPLLLEGLRKDSRTMPRVFQLIDWSNGGDGIVARDNIKTVADLRGQKVVLAQNSPSHYYLLHTLLAAGIQPSEIDFMFTKDAFQAAAALYSAKEIAAAVSWAPDIHSLASRRGFRVLTSTKTANKLLADVWFARADFAKDHPDIIEGLMRGIFDAGAALETDAGKSKAAALLARGFSMPATEAKKMLADVHWTNAAENRSFFLDPGNPTNFRRTYGSAHYIYTSIQQITHKVTFDQIADFSILKKLLREKKYAGQTDQYVTASARATPDAAPGGEILAVRYTLRFKPNTAEIDAAYDPNADKVIETIGRLAGTYGAARMVIEGHSDSTMKGRAPVELVTELSADRAAAVKRAVLERFPSLSGTQISTVGYGWTIPADPDNQALNRRVEVKLYKPE